MLSKPVEGEVLYLYLVVSPHEINDALIHEEEKIQWPVYHVSKRLLDMETKYGELEIAYALIMALRKLGPYFQDHTIEVLTNYPLRQVLQKSKASGRILKWAIKLSQFDLGYKPRTVIKGQMLAYLIAKFIGTGKDYKHKEYNDQSRKRTCPHGVFMQMDHQMKGGRCLIDAYKSRIPSYILCLKIWI